MYTENKRDFDVLQRMQLPFIYLTHVFATQELLGQVQQLQREYEQTQQVHDELKLRHDRMTGPANIYRKARELGFINAGPADQILEGQ